MPRRSNVTNHDALRAVRDGKQPTYHQAVYCIRQGWLTRTRRAKPADGRTWDYHLTDEGRAVLSVDP